MATGLFDRLLDLLQLWFLSPAVFVDMGEEELGEGRTAQDKREGHGERDRQREALKLTNIIVLLWNEIY